MSSIRQQEASRANGAKSHGPVTPEGKLASQANSAHSTGPVTPEGKARTAQNATAHGLLSNSIVLDRESAARFEELLLLLIEELRPEPGVETRCVHVMAAAHWRQMRIWALEKVQLAEETRKQEAAHPEESPESGVDEPAVHTAMAFRVLTDESRCLELLNRYEARCDRQYQRNLNCLKSHRRDKKKERKKEEKKQREREKLQSKISKQSEPEPVPQPPAVLPPVHNDPQCS